MSTAVAEHIHSVPSTDHRVTLHSISWAHYEMLLAIRGDDTGVRMTYLRGELELMSPSADHEGIKKGLARLLEAYAEEQEVDLNGYGSWTIRKATQARGIEPDECYMLGRGKNVPDLAIEVVWTSGGIDKLEVYRGLGVQEVWIWQDNALAVYRLHDGQYLREESSYLLPELDLSLLLQFLDPAHQTAAVRNYRRALQQMT